MAKSTQNALLRTGQAVVPAARPRYRQLADALIEEITDGDRPVGSTLPGELELMSEFGVSRHTVREALRRLESLGLIERRRRLGTIVKSSEPVEAYSHSVRSLGDLLQYPPGSRLEVLDARFVILDAGTAARLRTPARSRWFRLRAVRRLRARGAPICRVDVHVLPRFADVAREVGRSQLRVFELIEHRFGHRVAHVSVDVSAHAIDDDVAAALSVPRGSPGLRVVRRYFDDEGKLFEVTVSEHPADRFAYTLDLKREWLAPQTSVEPAT